MRPELHPGGDPKTPNAPPPPRPYCVSRAKVGRLPTAGPRGRRALLA